MEFIRKHWTYLLGALVLHALFAGVFGLTMISMQRTPPPTQLAIQAMVVDQSVLAKASRQRQRDRQRERDRVEQQQREQEAQKQKQQQEDIAKREAEQRAEQERQIELKQREEAEQRRLQEEQQQREAEKQRQAETERKRVEEIQRKQKEAAEKRRAAEEAKAQESREDELRKQLEAEEGEAAAEQSGVVDQYRAMIQQHIYRYWNKPPSAGPGLECVVRVRQTTGGAVLSADLVSCNGDAAVKQSVVNAVLRASPLPKPPDPRAFQSVIMMTFKPLE